MAWEECCFAFTVSDFGIPPQDGETDLQANLRHFGVPDAESAFKKLKFKEIHFEENEYSSRFAILLVETVTGDMINVIVKNGEIIDFSEDGAYLSWFEEDAKYAHKQRQTTLSKIAQSRNR
ncbi:MAG: hypothetical protein CR993_08085 [Rhodobacterales bacterium]|nr:MAG: hypothetical protein CR993_08085 [Rhodobacterales bacterium]